MAIDPVEPATLYAGTYGGGVFAIQQMDLGYRIYLPLIQRGQRDLSQTPHEGLHAMMQANVQNKCRGPIMRCVA